MGHNMVFISSYKFIKNSLYKYLRYKESEAILLTNRTTPRLTFTKLAKDSVLAIS